MPPEPPDPSDKSVLAALRSALSSNGYRSGRIDALVSREVTAAYLDGWYNPALRRTEPVTPLATLVRMFALGMTVPAQDLDAVPGAKISDWLGAGLASVRRGVVRPLVAIRPVRIWNTETYLACDAPEPGSGAPAFADFVRGVTPESSQLANMTLRRNFERALDMGTGDGIQALAASHHCEHVVATDVTARSLAFARFNLAWNAIENVELRLGDRYEPVAGETFDLIVSNPPYWITPALSARFLDSGLPTDAMSASAVTGAAEHLAPSGWAFVLCQWAEIEGESWQERARNWVSGVGCDAWAVRFRRADLVGHAVEGLAELGRVDPDKADRKFDEWMEYFDREGIEGVGTGFVVLRKVGERSNWFSAAELPQLPEGIVDECGEDIRRLFEGHTWVADQPAANAVLDAHWRPAEGVQMQTKSSAESGRWQAAGVTMSQIRGLRLSIELPYDLVDIVAKCDGSRTLRSIATEVFEGRWRDPERRTAEVDADLRKLVGAGFLVPVMESP